MSRWRRAAFAMVLAVALTAMIPVTVAAAARGGRDIGQVRSATGRFHNISHAEQAGYGVLTDLAGLTCIEDPLGTGAMGTHFVNGSLVFDGAIDPKHPEALLYDRTGKQDRLMGVEYVVLVADWGVNRPPPTLFGQEFMRVDAPNRFGLDPFYALHAWIWRANPAGMFEPFNPDVPC